MRSFLSEKVYSDQFLKRCCVDGMREIPMPYSCYRRSLYITEDWSCVLAFLRCCAEYRGEELGVVTRPPTTTLPPTTTPPPTTTHLILNMFHGYGYYYSESDDSVYSRMKPLATVHEDSHDAKMEEEEEEEQEFDEDDLADIEDIYVRSKFFESWLWTDIRLPSVPKSDG